MARLAKFSSGLIFAVDPRTGRIRPALHARRPRGRGDVQQVLLVARPVNFSAGLVFAVVPHCGSIRPALHARRPRGRGDVQPFLLVARLAQFSSGLIFAVEPLTSLFHTALPADDMACVDNFRPCLGIRTPVTLGTSTLLAIRYSLHL